MKLPILAAATAAVLALPASAHASLHTCNVQATNTATISSSRGMTCARAAKEMKNYRGNISKTFTTPGGFACGRVSGGQFGGQWRCVKGQKAFRFEFAD